MKNGIFVSISNWYFLALIILLFSLSCDKFKRVTQKNVLIDSSFQYKNNKTTDNFFILNREKYHDKLYGFWLGQCIANWTGLVTEMDKIGNIGELKTGVFYTREDWGKPDLPSIWGEGVPSDISSTIDFVFRGEDEIWGADDDTDIEYMYQHLLYKNKERILTSKQIKEGWIEHIRNEEENYLWVSNQKAFDLMNSGILPPATGDKENNPHYEMIDAQLTTEIFGLFSPFRPDFALKMAYLPIRTTARENTAWISEFYITMHSLASNIDESKPLKDQLFLIAEKSRKRLPDTSYSAKMYDYVKKLYDSKIPWEHTRDSVYIRYQVNQADGYDITSQKLYCNGCFAAGINFAASLVSLFYGEGDIIETIKIGTLAGWDSDNPTATWGGLLGFILGREGVERKFERTFSGKFNIHRTRQNFTNNGIDSFDRMAKEGIFIIDRVIQEDLKGGIDLAKDVWYIPKN